MSFSVDFFTMNDVPCEIVRHIFLCLDREEWRSILSVSKEWYSLGMRVFMEVLIYKGTKLLQLKNYKRSIKYFDQVTQAIDLVTKREFEQSNGQIISLKSPIIIISEEFLTKQSRVLNNKAVALMNLRKHEEAIQCLKEVLKIKPDHVKAMNNLGDNLNSLQKYEEAIEMFDKALSLDPNRLSVLYNKGNSYLHMKRYHEAIEWYDKAIQSCPSDADSLGNKAIALYRLGCSKEAIYYFDEVLKINSRDRIALRYKDFVYDEMRKNQLEEVPNLNQMIIDRKRKMDMEKRPNPIVVGVIGGISVGKSSLISRIINSPSVEGEKTTQRTIDVDGEWCLLNFIDISPVESKEFKQSIKNSDGFLLMYDILSEESLEQIPKLYKSINKIKGNKYFPCILMGNKVDLKENRKVAFEKGYLLAEQLKIGFVEVSTTVPINVNFSITSLLHKILQIKEKEEETRKLKEAKIKQTSNNYQLSTTPKLNLRKHYNCVIS